MGGLGGRVELRVSGRGHLVRGGVRGCRVWGWAWGYCVGGKGRSLVWVWVWVCRFREVWGDCLRGGVVQGRLGGGVCWVGEFNGVCGVVWAKGRNFFVFSHRVKDLLGGPLHVWLQFTNI
eukprot:816193-Prorocentrum_minimum.AAC.3